MKTNKVAVFKIFIFKIFKPLERVFAYNRMRRDSWVTEQAKKISPAPTIFGFSTFLTL